MKSQLFHSRRASLGLAIHGPFSRNRRRHWRVFLPACIAAVLLLTVTLFFIFLFI